MSRIRVVREAWALLKDEKKYWLTPIVVVLLLLALLMIGAESSALAPFIYTLF